MERLSELALEIVHVPGSDNIVADVLSRYGYERENAHVAPEPRFDTADISLHSRLSEWLQVVAHGRDLQECFLAAR